MTDAPRLPRPRADLEAFTPYRTQQMRADVRLQANEWAEPNPATAYLSAEELGGVLLNRYPGALTELREALAERWRVGPDQLIFGNGSNEVLLNTFLLFGGHGRTTLLFQPTYSMHARLTIVAGGTVAEELIGLPYELTPRRAFEAVRRVRPDIVVFTSPNNPTGTLIADDAILPVAENYPETLVLVDEAYAEFSGTTLLPALPEHPNLVLSKTFSKVRAAAGLRLGVLIAHPRLAESYRAVQLPYNVGALTLAVAARIAKDDTSVVKRVALLQVERARVYRALREVKRIEVYPSETNFLLFRVDDGDAAGWHARFLEHGVLIRDISSWPACAGCLRVSIGTPAENDRFIAAVEKVFAPSAARA
ncbi:MAG: aminotransferase class I/II-fold pyridoxal phosphate-dependent enzyme [Chloroflexota bacterium]|nr:aminotransferase class I/II-fold pyridoxal phosphate-dependent enzyme [Chloroflexota bacterium]